MEPTPSNLVCSNSLQNILNFRDIAQTINHIRGDYSLREGRIFRSARPVCTRLAAFLPFSPKFKNQGNVSLNPNAIAICDTRLDRRIKRQC